MLVCAAKRNPTSLHIQPTESACRPASCVVNCTASFCQPAFYTRSCRFCSQVSNACSSVGGEALWVQKLSAATNPAGDCGAITAARTAVRVTLAIHPVVCFTSRQYDLPKSQHGDQNLGTASGCKGSHQHQAASGLNGGPLSRIWARWIGLPRSMCTVQLCSNTQVRSFASHVLVSPHAGRQRHRLGDCGDCQLCQVRLGRLLPRTAQP
jgi:hypothetical protein